jgi:predicted choloylglycine hydrolase
MRIYRASAVLLMVILAAATVSVPLLAKQDGGSHDTSDSQVLYLSGTPREMGMQYGQYAQDVIVQNVDLLWEWAASEGIERDVLVAEAMSMGDYLTDAMVEQLEGMSETSGVSYEDLVTFNTFNDESNKQLACTCFAAAGTGTVDGQALSSKNRDIHNIQVLMFVEPLEGYSFMGMMSAGALGIAQGLNEKGVAIGHTWMKVPATDVTGFSPFIINQMVMEQCADVAEAVAFIDDVPKGEGATFILSDATVAAFVETVPTMYVPVFGNDVVVEMITNGAGVHTNHYVFEPFFTAVIEDDFGYMWTPSYARYDRGLELIGENDGVLTVDIVMGFARDLVDYGGADPNAIMDAHPEIPDDCWENGYPGFSICNARTMSATVLTTDMEYPEELSVMWMAINNPAWAPFVPLHNALLAEPEVASVALESFIEGTAWAAASQLRSSELYEWGDLCPVYEAWEAEKQVETDANVDYARSLLDKDKVSKAGVFLTEVDCAIALEGLELMQSLLVDPISFEMVAATVEA